MKYGLQSLMDEVSAALAYQHDRCTEIVFFDNGEAVMRTYHVEYLSEWARQWRVPTARRTQNILKIIAETSGQKCGFYI